MIILVCHILVNLSGFVGLIAATFKWVVQGKEKSDSNKFLENSWLLYTIGIILGSFLAKSTYGYFWVWDIKEILSIATSIMFFIFINIEEKLSKSLQKSLLILCFSLAIITFLSPFLFKSYH